MYTENKWKEKGKKITFFFGPKKNNILNKDWIKFNSSKRKQHGGLNDY